MKAVIGGKFIALNAYIKTLEKSHTSDLTAYLKVLEPKEGNSPRKRRWKVRLKSIKYKQRKQHKESMRQRLVL